LQKETTTEEVSTMTQYEKELEDLKTTNTVLGLQFQLSGVDVIEDMRLVTKEEAEDLRERIRAKLESVQ
jgi:hypothetical protein